MKTSALVVLFLVALPLIAFGQTMGSRTVTIKIDGLAASLSAANDIERRPDVRTILIDKVLELAKTRPLTLQQIEKTLDVRFAENRQSANEYVRFSSAAAKDAQTGLESVEVRFPTDPATTKEWMVIVLLNPSVRLTASEIRERFGAPDVLQVGRPTDPEGTTYTYRMKAGELRFGILREPNDRIRTIVIVQQE